MLEVYHNYLKSKVVIWDLERGFSQEHNAVLNLGHRPS